VRAASLQKRTSSIDHASLNNHLKKREKKKKGTLHALHAKKKKKNHTAPLPHKKTQQEQKHGSNKKKRGGNTNSTAGEGGKENLQHVQSHVKKKEMQLSLTISKPKKRKEPPNQPC